MDSGSGTLILENLFDAESLLASREWQPLRQGVSISILYECGEDGPVTALLHYAPGAKVPQHRHLGYEHILVLSGQQQDEKHVYKSGTLAVQAPGITHTVTSTNGCLALAIWERPVQFIET